MSLGEVLNLILAVLFCIGLSLYIVQYFMYLILQNNGTDQESFLSHSHQIGNLLIFNKAVPPEFEKLKRRRNKILVWAMRILGSAFLTGLLSIPFR